MKNRRRTPSSESTPRLEVASMLDVTFLLLIFFLCILEFRQLEGRFDVFLPRALGSAVADRLPIDIRLVRGTDSSSTVFVGSTAVDRIDASRYDAPALTRLEARLLEIRRRLPDVPAVIDAREGVHHGHVVAVVDTLSRARIDDVRFTIRRAR